ncbi:carbohydrate ABC transporter permease [Lachnotalea sp. AF33-28]|uniref:carbohydrate ABC transporter permease n=1 Tax=Lachnotalea sp. AF33-28 TaxID=2292046 RepID=UPI000E4D74D4|nr:carbohydrate ABC transporter permease [Lachnotalea sp. AF33-28]RHP32719.1 carbohydrate ABC transporter permease [Lachnotalea sp. AF33-28]
MKSKPSRKVFVFFNTLLMLLLCLLCLLPILHILAISLSEKGAVAAGYVKLFPVDFTLASYRYVMEKTEFWRSIGVTLKRLVLGSTLSIFLTILTAYPLSKPSTQFRRRTLYVWFLVITMLFNGGLIPNFMLVRELNLMDSIWALILPGIIPVFNVVLLLNFFRDLPKELEEAARMDGASHFRILWRIYVPLAAPAIATISLFTIVGYWNEWFSGMIYMNRPENYPLQTYLQSVVVQTSLTEVSTGSLAEMRDRMLISDRTFKSAQIFLGALPILCVYPWLQKYFTKGMTLGGVKG